jgi:hypothetical protein
MSAEQSNQPNPPNQSFVRSEVFIKHKVPRDVTPDLNPSPARPEGTGGLQDLIQAVTTLKDHTIKLSAQVNALQQKNQ